MSHIRLQRLIVAYISQLRGDIHRLASRWFWVRDDISGRLEVRLIQRCQAPKMISANTVAVLNQMNTEAWDWDVSSAIKMLWLFAVVWVGDI